MRQCHFFHQIFVRLMEKIRPFGKEKTSHLLQNQYEVFSKGQFETHLNLILTYSIR